jgi:mannitol/fructose-specific phosphotransferase system IIA component (Ntr-type)
LLSSERIVIWKEPVGKEVVLRRLVERIGLGDGDYDPVELLNAILERERQGSTFFNEGAAFPHARIDGLASSVISLGLTRQGVLDEPTEKPVELVFLILSPAENPDEQIKILALASRASQDRHFRQNLQSCRTPEEVMTAVRDWGWKEGQRAS